MPSPLTTTLVGFGAVLTSVSAVAGGAAAALGVLLQIWVDSQPVGPPAL